MRKASRGSLVLLFLAASICIILQICGMLSVNTVIVLPESPENIEERGMSTSESAPQFMLIRPIGNALPPRHHPNQTYNNLKFILENEVSDPKMLRKHWFLNRIVDNDLVQTIVNLLELHHQSYSIDPFELKEYAKRDFKLLRHRNSIDLVHTTRGTYQSDWTRRMTISSIYEPKTLYVMNVNEARNKLIEIGVAGGARWILPWDQNCFLSKDAWEKVKQDVLSQERDNKYFVTWMDRIHGKNDDLLKENYLPNPWEEPQIIFRHDAVERFDEYLRYGRRDKAALLVRLNVPGDWWKWGWDAWERRRSFENMSIDVNLTAPKAGWVARLNSGNSKVERRGTGRQRELLRSIAVTNMLDRLDEMTLVQIHGFKNTTLLFYDENELNEVKSVYQQGFRNHTHFPSLYQIIADANKAMEFGPWSVVDKEYPGPSNNKHDYYSVSISSYFMDPLEDEVSRELFDTDRFVDFAYNTTSLAFGWYVTGNISFAEKAAENLDVWFVNEETRMIPSLAYSGILPGMSTGSTSGVAEFSSIYFLLDAIRLVRRSGTLSKQSYDSIFHWMRSYLHWLLESQQGKKLYLSNSIQGVWYDIQVSAIAAFLNEKKIYGDHASTVRSRMIAIFSPSGRLLPNPKHPPPSILLGRDILKYWSIMGQISRKAGINIYKYLESDGESMICLAIYGHVPCCNSDSAICTSIMESGVELRKWAPIAKTASHFCKSLTKMPTCLRLAAHSSSDGAFAKPENMPPYWVLKQSIEH